MSSKREQLEYQKNVPIAYVSNELFWGWQDSYRDAKEMKWFSGIYSQNELQVLSELDAEIKRIRRSLPQEVPYITDFIGTSEWAELSKVCQRALSDLRAIKK